MSISPIGNPSKAREFKRSLLRTERAMQVGKPISKATFQPVKTGFFQTLLNFVKKARRIIRNIFS